MSKARDIASAAPAPSTVSATELGYLDGVTSAVQTQLNAKQATVSGVNDTEIGYLDGVTSAIQTQINSKIGQSTAINPSTITAKGDLIVGTGAGTFVAQAVGTNGTVLTANSAQADGVEWAAVAAGSNYSLLNSGGTALTGAATITVSGISGKDKIRILVKDISSASAASTISLRINADSGSNYNMFGGASKFNNTSEGPVGRFNGPAETSARVLILGNNVSANGDAAILIDGANSAGVKIIEVHSGANGISGEGGQDYMSAVKYDLLGTWNNSATVTSVSLISSAGNFDAGTMYVYTSA